MGFIFRFDPLSCHHWGAVIGPSQSSVIQIVHNGFLVSDQVEWRLRQSELETGARWVYLLTTVQEGLLLNCAPWSRQAHVMELGCRL